MRFLSICSGIEAASVAWHPLGWRAAGFAEIEPFPSAVLAHHWPDVPNLGDMTKHHDWPDTLRPELIVGGTPCQAFSVAGLRKGLEDPRGNLTLVFLGILARYRPRWVVWENVPGVLSDGTGAFGAFLGGLGKLGYGFAYRVLDAQYFGVPQRRRRVFVVGHLGDWRRAAAVLFEPESLRGDSPPRREACEKIAATIKASSANRGYQDNGDHAGDLIPVAYRTSGNCGAWETGDRVDALTTGTDPNSHIVATLDANYGKLHGASGQDLNHGHSHLIAHSLRGEGFDASKDGTGRGTPLVPVAFDMRGREGGAQFEGPHNTANIRAASGGSSRSYVAASAVRRLTPTECERLQGFPDCHTLIPWRGKPAADGPRYKALGNSMAVPVMRWIGRRIQSLED